MRKPFIQTLIKLAENDKKIVLIVGDVGFRFIDDFRAKFPEQYLNVGVLEQSMMGIAAGMARQGFRPVVYTMRNFVAFRPYEAVRNDIAFGNANVKLFGVSGSAAYKFLGFSHNVISGENGREDEDIEMLRRLPNMVIHQPKTEEECASLVEAEYKRIGPAYFII